MRLNLEIAMDEVSDLKIINQNILWFRRYLKKILEDYDDNAGVIIVDWTNGQEYEPTVGGDDEDEGSDYCRIGIE